MQDKTNFDPVLKNDYGRKDMPISSYYKNHGREVMAKMRKSYGEKADEVFYATANKKPMFKPKTKMRGAMEEAMKRGRKYTD